jgi:hypothetical protein
LPNSGRHGEGLKKTAGVQHLRLVLLTNHTSPDKVLNQLPGSWHMEIPVQTVESTLMAFMIVIVDCIKYGW